MFYNARYNSPIGELYITADDKALLSVSFSAETVKNKAQNKIVKDTINQLDEYFTCKRKSFDLPLCPNGTEFQKRVWNALLKIPYGEVRSYKDIAIAIGNPNASRAVGHANNQNPIAIIIPCHRVIGSNGDLIGYGGGLDKKRILLNLEKKK